MKKYFNLFGLKNLGLFAILVASLLSNACNKCELIDQVITNPPVDTMATCEGVFYINQAGPNIDLSFFFNEFNKPIPDPFEYANGPGPDPVGTRSCKVFLIRFLKIKSTLLSRVLSLMWAV